MKKTFLPLFIAMLSIALVAGPSTAALAVQAVSPGEVTTTEDAEKTTDTIEVDLAGEETSDKEVAEEKANVAKEIEDEAVTTNKPGGGLLYGQKHAYTVIFRGNGEAISLARLAITNPDDEPLKEYSFTIPDVDPTELTVFQQILPDTCLEYDYDDLYEYACLEYGVPDYTESNSYFGFGDYYYGGETEYEKIDLDKSGEKYTFDLPKEIPAYESGGLIVAYAAKGYTTTRSGRYEYAFQTIQVPSRIEEVKVGVDVDTNLYLKGERSSVSYADDTSSYGAKTMAEPLLMEDAAVSGLGFDDAIETIGYGGVVERTAKNLAPGESMVVPGAYATSWWRMNAFALSLAGILILLLFAGSIVVSVLRKQKKEEAAKQEMGRHRIHIFDAMYSGFGLLTIALFFLLTFGVMYYAEGSLVGSDGGALFLLIVLMGMYPIVGIGFPIWALIKRGWPGLVSVLLTQFIWGLIFIVFLTALSIAKVDIREGMDSLQEDSSTEYYDDYYIY